MNQKSKLFFKCVFILVVVFAITTIASLGIFKATTASKIYNISSVKIANYNEKYDYVDIVSINPNSADYKKHYSLSDREELIDNIEDNDEYVYRANFSLKICFDNDVHINMESNGNQNIIYGEYNLYDDFNIKEDSDGLYFDDMSSSVSTEKYNKYIDESMLQEALSEIKNV